MHKPKIMILGAGIYQVPLIRQAKQMGLETFVCSVPGNYPGIAYADHFYPVNTRDKEAVLSLASEHAIDGICTSGTDVAVASIGYVCDRMHLAGISHTAADLVTDKAKMKEAFAAGGVSTAPFYRVHTLEEAYEKALALGYPVVIKPVDSSGSRGIRKVSAPEELPDAWAAAKRRTTKDYLLLESFIDASEIGVDGFVGADGFLAFFPHTKYTYTTPEGTTIPAGHFFPYHAAPSQQKELHRQMQLAVRALGLSNCPFNADVFVKGDQVWIIEVGGRTGATCIPELISINQGYNWYEKLLEAALGRAVSFASAQDLPSMSQLLFTPVDTVVRAVDREGIRRYAADHGLMVHVDYTEGSKVDAVHNATDRIGHVIAAVSDPAQLAEHVRHISSYIELEAGNLANLCETYRTQIRYGA